MGSIYRSIEPMKEKVCRDRSHNHDTISLIPKSSYLLSSFRGDAPSPNYEKTRFRKWRKLAIPDLSIWLINPINSIFVVANFFSREFNFNV